MKLYRIKDWERFYEVSDSRKVDGPLSWVAVRTKTDGFGYLQITQQKDRSDLLSAWYLMLGIAAKQPKANRGQLSRDGIPLTPDDMELLTRFPAPLFAKALTFFANPKQGWLECVDVLIDPDASGQIPPPSGQTPPTGQDRTGQDRTGQDIGANGSPPASKSVDDAAWLAELAAMPAYAGIDVPRELSKMQAWCSTNGKQPSRRRFVNWLNRSERPMAGAGRGGKGVNSRPDGEAAKLFGYTY